MCQILDYTGTFLSQFNVELRRLKTVSLITTKEFFAEREKGSYFCINSEAVEKMACKLTT